jgi:hypothetical protein
LLVGSVLYQVGEQVRWNDEAEAIAVVCSGQWLSLRVAEILVVDAAAGTKSRARAALAND